MSKNETWKPKETLKVIEGIKNKNAICEALEKAIKGK